VPDSLNGLVSRRKFGEDGLTSLDRSFPRRAHCFRYKILKKSLGFYYTCEGVRPHPSFQLVAPLEAKK